MTEKLPPKVYVLNYIVLIEYEFEEEYNEFFLTEEAMHQKRQELEEHYNNMSGITNVCFCEHERTLDELKDLMTIEQFEELFNVSVNILV